MGSPCTAIDRARRDAHVLLLEDVRISGEESLYMPPGCPGAGGAEGAEASGVGTPGAGTPGVGGTVAPVASTGRIPSARGSPQCGQLAAAASVHVSPQAGHVRSGIAVGGLKHIRSTSFLLSFAVPWRDSTLSGSEGFGIIRFYQLLCCLTLSIPDLRIASVLEDIGEQEEQGRRDDDRQGGEDEDKVEIRACDRREDV